MESIGSWWMWLGFVVFVVVAVAVDLLVMKNQLVGEQVELTISATFQKKS